jgi:hypothetical protein
MVRAARVVTDSGSRAVAVELLADHYAEAALGDEGVAAHLVTVSEAGWPHAAMLSVGEIVVRADGRVALALWSGTRTTANVERTGQATLLVVLGRRAVRAYLALAPAAAAPAVGKMPLAFFTGTVEEAVAEAAPYAELVDGVRFVLDRPERVLERWRTTREQLDGLLG